jgi:aminoglycoside 6'-N-acetyltransferase I
MTVRPAAPADVKGWLRMRCALWPEGQNDHPAEIEDFFAGHAREPLAVLVAEDGGSLLGFVELSIRNIAEGCSSGRVAYLEGWYVEPSERRRGIGRALVAGAEQWGRTQGCTEFGSDAEIENDASAAAHLALGFEEVERVRCFRKSL